MNPMKLNKRKKLDWLELWINKCDYIDSYYENVKGKCKTIDESIDYYITMIQMAIYYLRDYSNYYDYVYVQHNIILKSEMTIKEDVKERDFAEYLKYLFYTNCDINYIEKLINKYYRKFNYYLVIARLIFPSYYLYYLEKVLVSKDGFAELKRIVDMTSEYETFLKLITNKMNEYLSKKIVLPF